MNKNLRKVVAILSAALILTTGSMTYAKVEVSGSAAKQDTSYTLEEMLTYAIQDEYAAQAEYNIIMNMYGAARPFSNIIRAEDYHISLLKPLFEKYDYTVPKDDAVSLGRAPSSLAQAYEIGVDAEIKNIDMYKDFLEEDLPADVKYVFTSLMNASVNHQKAFQNSLDRSAGTYGTGNVGRGNQGFGGREYGINR